MGTGRVIRAGLRWLLALFYALAGYMHLADPAPFLAIMPGWVPAPEAVIWWTGIAELLGAVALAQPFSQPLRHAGAMGLALYAICVFPANIHHFALDMARPDGGWGLGYHLPRMVAQPLLVWLALWTGGATDWPLRRR
ncbi:DoxX family protein [Qipengyuania sp. YG27]|uniref:DoxX family protein n=1 Tax=Qipengyuania mesophila TaxID=2867246 RepID=A0ABS7JT53_9SPHN|nr:DoxX family protein [Qipengyuania mesophila]